MKEFLRKEWKTMARFVLVGGSSFAVKAALYYVLSRFLWTAGSRTLENAIALTIATVYNYALHRFWTFSHQKPAPGSATRYLIVLVIANIVDIGIFYVGESVLGLYDMLVLAAASVMVAGGTFIAHRIFTFHKDPWRKGLDA